MASTYPSAADSFFDPSPDTAGDRVLGEDWNRLLDALLAVEVTLGVNPQGAHASVHARLNKIFSWDSGYFTASGNALAIGHTVAFNRLFGAAPLVIVTMTDVGSDTSVSADLQKVFGVIASDVTLSGFTAKGFNNQVPGGGHGYNLSTGTPSFRFDWLAMDMT